GWAGSTAACAAASLPSTDFVLATGVFGGDHFRDQSGPTAAAVAESGNNSETTSPAVTAKAVGVRRRDGGPPD
ncbi:hypothetical protein, partial [Kitasatospora sp. NPDC057198]|uniref:hypothetical protein n=1 Tax=Kitasatospora sp. NPDC057198 TaxID=3346046 RepID=UPI00363ABABD